MCIWVLIKLKHVLEYSWNILFLNIPGIIETEAYRTFTRHILLTCIFSYVKKGVYRCTGCWRLLQIQFGKNWTKMEECTSELCTVTGYLKTEIEKGNYAGGNGNYPETGNWFW